MNKCGGILNCVRGLTAPANFVRRQCGPLLLHKIKTRYISSSFEPFRWSKSLDKEIEKKDENVYLMTLNRQQMGISPIDINIEIPVFDEINSECGQQAGVYRSKGTTVSISDKCLTTETGFEVQQYTSPVNINIDSDGSDDEIACNNQYEADPKPAGVYRSKGITVFIPELCSMTGIRRYRSRLLPKNMFDDIRVIYYK